MSNVATGAAVTFTATVTPAITGGTITTGTVSFITGTTTLGTAPVQSNGEAVLTTTALPPGVDNVSTSYSGDTNYTASASPAVTEYVGTIAPTYTTAVTVSTGAISASQPVTLTATVTPSGTGIATPTGTVAFVANGVSLGSAVVQDGVATLTTSSVASGVQTVSATFSGNTGESAASNPVTLMVYSRPTSIAVPSVSGASLPASNVAGTKLRAKLPVVIKNTSAATLFRNVPDPHLRRYDVHF